MKGAVLTAAVVYFGLVANFYYQSHGFTKFYNEYYPLWKVTPVVFLAAFSYLHGAGLGDKERKLSAAGLLFGALGDYLIGISHEGIVPGAIAFGIGHIFYMAMFINSKSPIHYPTAAFVLLWGAGLGHICLIPLLPNQPLAVAIMTTYSILLSACVIFSVSAYLLRTQKDNHEGLYSRFLGFALFFASDSNLILNHTGFRIPFAELIILASYYSAQFFILNSFIAGARTIRQKSQ